MNNARGKAGYRVTWAIAAVIAAALFAGLGIAVARYGEPAGLLTWEESLVNHATLVAWWLTRSCYPPALVPVAVGLLVVAWFAPAWRVRILFSIAILLLSWRGADLFQHFFARPRRLDWVVKHERSFSYPSSHAAIAVGFYALWGAMLYLSELPPIVRKVGAFCLVLLAVAICWSRLALGAHYLTDLAGSALLAVALVSAGLALLPRAILPGGVVAGRPFDAAE